MAKPYASPKRIGLLHELKAHGPEAFDNEVVEWKRGPRSEVQAWADEREVALIAEHGGPLRDPSVRCKQTLNLDKGGKRGCSFEAKDALRTAAWLTFQDEMDEYVECHGTALVPIVYVNSESGYKLGMQLRNVRQGMLWRGHPDEAERIEWLEALPRWAWNAKETDEWREALGERAKKQFETPEAREALSERAKKQFETPEAREALSERAKKQFESPAAREALSERGRAQWANASEETRAKWRRKNSEAHSRPEVKAAHSKRARKQWANASEEKRAEWSRKMTEAQNRPEVKAAASERRRSNSNRQRRARSSPSAPRPKRRARPPSNRSVGRAWQGNERRELDS